MGENMVYVSSREYRDLCETIGRVKAFANYLTGEKYDIKKEDCARMLGIELDGEGNE